MYGLMRSTSFPLIALKSRKRRSSSRFPNWCGRRWAIAWNRAQQDQYRGEKILLREPKTDCCPHLQAYAELTNNGLSGPVNPLYNGCCGDPDAYFIGGSGNAFAQMLRRNFPITPRDSRLLYRFAIAPHKLDYVTDQLQLRQGELQLQRTANQVTVDVKTAVIGLQQARTRYQTSVDTRVLAEQA